MAPDSPHPAAAADRGNGNLRFALSVGLIAVMAMGFGAVSVQLVRLALAGQDTRLAMQSAQPVVHTYSRPDIVDRNGRLLATDLAAYSLFADPQTILDADEASEALTRIFPELNRRELRAQLADKSKRFVWIKRGLAAPTAQRVHNLGFPGLEFRTEPKRRYPQGRLAGHILGSVNVDNKGISGLERHIDVALGLESGLAGDTDRPPVELTIDIGIQHGLEEELATAMAKYASRGAAGVILDAVGGEVLAAASLPDLDPASPAEALQPERLDRLHTAGYELGSVFKLMTVAMVLENGLASPTTTIDVTTPLQAGAHTIVDPHPSPRPLTVTEILVRSSNVGAGRLALLAGSERQRSFLQRLGLNERLVTEVGIAAAPVLPERWGEAETVTISYGHGLSVPALQFAAATAALVNGGLKITPHFVRPAPGTQPALPSDARVVRPQVSAMLRDMLRRNVSEPGGTGQRAAVPGYEIGGKTGTAEMAIGGNYRETSVISSFAAAFPISRPRYVVLVLLVEPRPTAEAGGRIVAGANAAPLAAAVIRRTGPLLTTIAASTRP